MEYLLSPAGDIWVSGFWDDAPVSVTYMFAGENSVKDYESIYDFFPFQAQVFQFGLGDLVLYSSEE